MGMASLEETYALLWGVQRSGRYHGRRRALFERLHQLTLWGVVLSVGGVAARLENLLNAEWVSWCLALLAGILVSTNVVGRFAERAELHRTLSTRHARLEASLRPLRALGDEEYSAALRERLDIEADEPPIMRLLDVLCHYELLRGTRSDLAKDAEQVTNIPLWRRALAHWASQASYVAAAPFAKSST